VVQGCGQQGVLAAAALQGAPAAPCTPKRDGPGAHTSLRSITTTPHRHVLRAHSGCMSVGAWMVLCIHMQAFTCSLYAIAPYLLAGRKFV
jgi:hypothetical protein